MRTPTLLLPLALAGTALCGPVACQSSAAKAETAATVAPAPAPRAETAATVAPAPAAKAETATVAPTLATKTLVYYFHATTRCATCRAIEAYAHEAVMSAFAAELEAGGLEWRAVNVDEPSNRHFIGDFRLYTRSVVVVDAEDPRRYRNLERVWQLVRDKAAFQRYVEQEVRAFRRS